MNTLSKTQAELYTNNKSKLLRRLTNGEFQTDLTIPPGIKCISYMSQDCYSGFIKKCDFCGEKIKHVFTGKDSVFCIQCFCIWFEHKSGVKLIEHMHIY